MDTVLREPLSTALGILSVLPASYLLHQATWWMRSKASGVMALSGVVLALGVIGITLYFIFGPETGAGCYGELATICGGILILTGLFSLLTGPMIAHALKTPVWHQVAGGFVEVGLAVLLFVTIPSVFPTLTFFFDFSSFYITCILAMVLLDVGHSLRSS